jgi:YesN/AraC family two-component response regulator
MSLQEIAYEVGIANYNYFYILFKETYGISPSDFLKRIESEAP